MRRAAITMATMVTIGIFLIGGLVEGVVQVVQTRAIATEAKGIAVEARDGTASLKDSVDITASNVWHICRALKIPCEETKK